MQPLKQISRYKIERILGKGAVGTVYKAYDPIIRQTVAIKVIHKDILEQDETGEQLQRFRNEVLAGRQLKHPNIVSIYEYGEENNDAYIIMEYVEGQQLKDFLDKNFKFDLGLTQTIMQQLLSALNYAHNRGIVHRDIKPANILVMPNWQLQVADFGIAHIENSALTHTGMIMGTPNYMSPEQCLGERIDYRTDLFSAGVVLYYLLSGKRPFESENMVGTIQKILNENPITPSLLNPEISSLLNGVVNKALAKKPSDRFQSAAEFSEALTKTIGELLDIDANGTVNEKTVVKGNGDNTHFDRAKTEPTGMPVDNTVLTESSLIPSKKPIPIRALLLIGTALASILVIAYSIVHLEKKEVDFDALLAQFPCSVLTSDTSDDGKVLLRGYVEASQLKTLQDRLNQLPGNIRAEANALRPLSNSFCRVLETLSPLKKFNDQKKLGLKLALTKSDNHFFLDDFLEMNITLPNYDGYLYVDYFQLNGQVAHLYPSKDEQRQPITANASQLIGQDNSLQVSLPLGTELISAIVSTTPLFDKLRPEDEATEVYMESLKNLGQRKETILSANCLVIETSGR